MMKTYKRVNSVTLSTDILTFLSNQREPVPAGEIGQALGKPYGTVMCQLATLEDARFVGRVGDHYELGQGAALLWARRKAALSAKAARAAAALDELDG